MYYGEAGMRIERCRDDCVLQAAGEQLSHKFLIKDKFDTGL